MALMVRPWQLERADVVHAYEDALGNFPNLLLADVTRGVARRAARLRATFKIRPADALHIATALTHDATIFVPNDHDLARVDALEVMVLDAFVA